MKTLTLKVNDEFYIGKEVKARILEINGLQIRIGIDAPKDIGIWRSEIYDRIQAQKEAANG